MFYTVERWNDQTNEYENFFKSFVSFEEAVVFIRDYPTRFSNQVFIIRDEGGKIVPFKLGKAPWEKIFGIDL